MSTASEVRRIALSEPWLHGSEGRYLQECLDTNWVSSAGPFVREFEERLAALSARQFAVAVASGTAALHVSLIVSGVQREDEVIVPALTFIAPANAVRYVGAHPVFVDVEPEYWQIDVTELAGFLRRGCRLVGERLVNHETGRTVSAILAVDVLGHPVDADPLRDLAAEFGLALIEDATESLGAAYKGRPAGALGSVACFSFNGNKVVTCGGGGMIVTDDEAAAARARYLSTQAKDDPVEYVHHHVGFNYRLTNLQAALGVGQLEWLDTHVAAKRRIAERYRDAFSRVPGLTFMRQAPWASSSFWLSTVLVDAAAYGMTSRALLGHLAETGIESRPLWEPLHRSRAHAGSPRRVCPVAERLYDQALSLPSSPGLSEDDQRRVIEAVLRSASA
ncbi:MAG: LegC family aminotransferase [Acidobacteriota bacterium]